MLFRKKIPKDCSYCKHAAKVDDAYYLCTKKGMVSGEKACRKFKYDPCKRIPVKAKTLDFRQYDDDNFTL